MKLRESFIKKDNKLFAEVSRILVEEFKNGRKDAMGVVTTEDGKTAAKVGILTPIVVSPDSQKRTDDNGKPLLSLHNGERRVRMSLLAQANGFYGEENSPLLINGVLCIPVTMDKAANYTQRTEDLTRQLILNSGVNWTDADYIYAAVEYVDTEGGKAEDFGIAATMKREAVQRLLKIGRTPGLVELIVEGSVKNTAVADVIAKEIKKRKGKLTLATVLEILDTISNQTAKAVEAAIKEAMGDVAKETKTKKDTAPKTEKKDLDNEGGQGGKADLGGKSYSFCKEVTALNDTVQDEKGLTLYTKEIVGLFARGYSEKLTVVELLAELKEIEANRDNLFVE